ncbi:hypothetical protein QWZ03_14520 [Chitinimonas viridis]|uniref:GTPase n=1 Tax=Chitinimonas viridis TaxID=664880 RepID=A0ABT8B8M9_9NEIS|nr:hypothetical protein [Chitinimonas viridis]MDN3577981.1 hypothetical protein [Chitinimonas viridis]
MHALDLPPFDASLPMEFADARGFRDWLKLVPMINVRQAHGEVLDTLARLNVSPVLPIERLKMLEMLREPVAMLQEENAKRYFGKPFPLALTEDGIWLANNQLWLAMSTGYRHCWQAAIKGDVMVADHKALAGQRALRYAALAIREHHLAYRVVPQARWDDLYALYQIATDADVATKIVKDSLNKQTELSSCHAAFLQALLLAAANPSSMPVRQIIWTDRLLDRWSNQAAMATVSPADQDKGVLAFNLAAPGELKRHDPPPSGEGWRFLDIDPIGKSIKKRIKYLRAGESPAQLGLGEEYAATTVENHLIGLYQEWCDLPIERGMPRRPARDDAPEAQVGLGLVATHFAVGGERFGQPAEPMEVRGRAIADFQLFGGQAHHLSAAKVNRDAEPEPEMEAWRVHNESALGFKLERNEPGGRLMHGQLVAVRPRPGQGYMVGTVRWLLEGSNGEIAMGVRALPGMPQAVAVRATGLNTFSNRFTQALLLPGMPTLQALPSLLLPPTWFKAGRIIEVHIEGQIKKVRLDQLIERGQDFERVAFQGEIG